MKAATTEQTANQYGDSDNNSMGSIGDQAVNNYKSSIDYLEDNHNYHNAVTSWEVVGIKQIHNIAIQVLDGTGVVIVVTWITWVKTFTTDNIEYMGLEQHIFSISSVKQQFHRKFTHLTIVPFSGYQCATMIPLFHLRNSISFLALYFIILLFR